MKKHYLSSLLLSMALCAGSVQAQQIDLSLLKNMKARNIGPGSMSGRVTTVAVVEGNTDVMYIGGASGGVWKSENGGATWKSVFDANPTINIGSIAIQQNNPNVVWVGTGEGNPRNSMNLGQGIYKSLDGGRTWKCMGLEKTVAIHRILIDPQHPNTVYAGVMGNPFADHAERGVFKSTDGGETWSKILFTNTKSGVGDMVMDPSNPNKLLVNMWQMHRTSYDFKSGGPGSGFYMTLDGGKNWTKLDKNNGMPEGDLGRIGIAIAASNPNRVYAMIESAKNALYRSDDGGYHWEMINNDPTFTNNRPFYFQDIAVDPQNENRLYNIYQMIARSEDGGKSFEVIIPYSGVHPDHHAWWINPKDPSFMIDGNDGGIAITRDRGKKWSYVESLPLGQFYHINVDNEIPYNVYGGLQDNGSWTGPAYIWREGGIRNAYWQTLLGGDGFDVTPDPENSRYGYAMSQGGALARYDKQSGYTYSLRPPAPDLKTRLRFNWNAAFALDPTNASTIYYGSQFLHKSSDKGLNWEIISPDLTLNNPEQQKQEESGGLTIDITAAENHNTILTIAPSKLNNQVIWVGTDDGNVQLTRDGGKTWVNLTSKILGLPKESWIPQIQASRYNAAEAWVVANNYRQGDFGAYIFRTKDFGKTWERVVDNTKVKGYALCVLQDPAEPKLVFAGTENGLWVSLDEGKTFSQWKNDYPSVSTMDLAIQEREADLAIATFGRGIWILDDIKPLRKLAAQGLSKDFFVIEPSTAVEVKGRLAAVGIEFQGDATYEATNRNTEGAKIPFFVKAPKNPAPAKDKPADAKIKTAGAEKAKAFADTLVARIYNDQGKLIRTLSQTKLDTGLNYLTWNLDAKGIRYPGRAKSKEKYDEIGGETVLPGNYKAVLQLGNNKDSVQLNFIADPRVPFSKEVQLAKQAVIDRLSKSVEKLTQATDQLDESSELAGKIAAQLNGLESKEAKDLSKAAKAQQDSIKKIREILFGKRLEKQGYGRPYQLTALNKLNDAQGAISDKPTAPGAQTLNMVAQAEQMAQEFIDRVNAYFSSEWPAFQKKVEETKVNLFKAYTPIK
ncbi:MAG: VPS10 domain-containing protein [Sphingobacteriaceae bacterium]